MPWKPKFFVYGLAFGIVATFYTHPLQGLLVFLSLAALYLVNQVYSLGYLEKLSEK
jgi:hypothetical protein